MSELVKVIVRCRPKNEKEEKMKCQVCFFLNFSWKFLNISHGVLRNMCRALSGLKKAVKFTWKIHLTKKLPKSNLFLTALTMEIHQMNQFTVIFVIRWWKVCWKATTVQYLLMAKQVINLNSRKWKKSSSQVGWKLSTKSQVELLQFKKFKFNTKNSIFFTKAAANLIQCRDQFYQNLSTDRKLTKT